MERFRPVDWEQPFDPGAELAAVLDGTISGMFPAPLLARAKKRGITLPSARDRYQPFKFYPLIEHAHLLLETCERFYPKLSTRQALRTIGHYAPATLLGSTLGKVVLGTAEGAHETIAAMAKAYALNVRPGFVTVVDSGDTHAVLQLDEISYFLDSHHVGVFEGLLTHAKLAGVVLLARQDACHAEFLLKW